MATTTASSTATSSSTRKARVINTIPRADLARRFSIAGLQVRSDALTLFEMELKHATPPYESPDEFIFALCDVLLTRMNDLGRGEDGNGNNNGGTSTMIDTVMANKALEMLRETRRDALTVAMEIEGGASTTETTTTEPIVYRNVIDDNNGTSAAAPQTTTTTITTSSHINHHQISSSSNNNQFKHQLDLIVQTLKAMIHGGKFRLNTIDELNTYDLPIELPCIVVAMIRSDPSRIMEYIAQDTTGKVPITFEQENDGNCTNFREWATFENGIYVIEGTYEASRDSLIVRSIGLPPPIKSIIIPSPSNNSSSSSSFAIVEGQPHSVAVIIADIHLDDPLTFDALKKLFTGFVAFHPPPLFVLMGNFASTQQMDRFEFKDLMKRLIALIGSYRRLASRSKFVFIPGPNDLRHIESGDTIIDHHNTTVLFQHPFTSDHFPTSSTNKLADYHLASNPFHLQLYGKHLCLYAGGKLHDRIVKNVIHASCGFDYHQTSMSDRRRLLSRSSSSSSTTIVEDNFDSLIGSLGRLLISSSHLSAGLYRQYPSEMSLLPRIPDTILLADIGSDHMLPHRTVSIPERPTVQLVTGCSFSRDRFKFLCYYAENNEMEESQVDL